jgi:hypothetical protein
MSTEIVQATEYGDQQTVEDIFAHDNDNLTAQVEREEQGRFRAFIGRVAARAALVGALTAGLFAGTAVEEAQAAPTHTGPVACSKGGVQGMQMGSVCVTRQEAPKPSGECTKVDQYIGEAAINILTLAMPVGEAIKTGVSFISPAVSIHNGGFCG